MSIRRGSGFRITDSHDWWVAKFECLLQCGLLDRMEFQIKIAPKFGSGFESRILHFYVHGRSFTHPCMRFSGHAVAAGRVEALQKNLARAFQ